MNASRLTAFPSIFSVIDITSSWDGIIQISDVLQKQIMSIGLFDIWVANEYRNWNNANLLYDVITKKLMVIDHGCILNTATFDYNLSLLTENETILYSDLSNQILKDITPEASEILMTNLKNYFYALMEREEEIKSKVLANLPISWKVNQEMIRKKLDQLFELDWADRCWETFVEYYNECRNG